MYNINLFLRLYLSCNTLSLVILTDILQFFSGTYFLYFSSFFRIIIIFTHFNWGIVLVNLTMNLIQIHIAFLIIQLLKRLVFCSLGFSFHVFSQIYHIGRETLRQLIKDDYGWFDSSKRSTSNFRLVENYNTRTTFFIKSIHDSEMFTVEFMHLNLFCMFTS